ncbi:hypothetical protein MEC_01343, partial [Bartonella alsatica IBS 382]
MRGHFSTKPQFSYKTPPPKSHHQSV